VSRITGLALARTRPTELALTQALTTAAIDSKMAASSSSIVHSMRGVWFGLLCPPPPLPGAVIPEAIAAAERLGAAGIPEDVICVTSPGPVFKALLARQDQADAPSWILDQVLPASRATPLLTVLDGHPHTVAFLAIVNQVPSITLGVTRFGQSGSIQDVYRRHCIDTDSIVRAGLNLTSRQPR
jgi:hypothetical protein